jgi:AraC-like DNA-binding protein
MGTVLSTNGVSERERLSYWQDLIKRTFGYTEIETTNLSERPFSGTIHLDQLAFLGVAEVTSMRSRIARTPRAAEPTTNSVKAIYQLAGESLIEQGRHSAQLTLGDWVVIDCAQPYMLINTTDYYHHLIVQFPMNELKARLPQAAHAAGCVLPSGKGLVRVTSDFLRATWRELPQITATVRQQLATTLMDLLVSNLSELIVDSRSCAHPQAVLLVEVKSFIHYHLSDPELSVDMIARHLNLSKSYIHQIFRGEDTTVSRYIWDLRLEKCRADLIDPCHRYQSITDIVFGWGFNNSSHFCRLFKEHYGLSARDYRHDGFGELTPEPAARRGVTWPRTNA